MDASGFSSGPPKHHQQGDQPGHGSPGHSAPPVGQDLLRDQAQEDQAGDQHHLPTGSTGNSGPERFPEPERSRHRSVHFSRSGLLVRLRQQLFQPAMAAVFSTSGPADARRRRLAGRRRRHQPENVPKVFQQQSGFPETCARKMLATRQDTTSTGIRASSKLDRYFFNRFKMTSMTAKQNPRY